MVNIARDIIIGVGVASLVGSFMYHYFQNDKRAIENKPKVETQSIIGEGIVIVEECEYFRIRTYRGYDIFVHKGNCKNPIHYCKCSK